MQKLDLEHARDILSLHYLPGLRLAFDEVTEKLNSIIQQLEGAANGTAPTSAHGGGRRKGRASLDPSSINNRTRAYLAEHQGETMEARDVEQALGIEREQARGALNYIYSMGGGLKRLSRGIYQVEGVAAPTTTKAKSLCPVCQQPYYPEGMWPHIRRKHPEYKGGVSTPAGKQPRDNSAYRTPEFREKMRQARLHWTQTPEGRAKNAIVQAKRSARPGYREQMRQIATDRWRKIKQQEKNQ